jgi:hypothetical protein
MSGGGKVEEEKYGVVKGVESIKRKGSLRYQKRRNG